MVYSRLKQKFNREIALIITDGHRLNNILLADLKTCNMIIRF